MLFPEAQSRWAQFLSPLSLDEFLDRTLLGPHHAVEVRPGDLFRHGALN
jgi:hypothetical protein